MCRFVDAGRRVGNYPLVWLSLLTWALLTPLVHWLMPITPAHQFDLAKAARVLDADAPFFDRDPWTVAISSDGHTVVKLQGAQPTNVRVWDVQRRELQKELTTEQVGLGTLTYPVKLSDNDEWLTIRTQDAKGFIDVRFFHMPTGKMGPAIPTFEFIFSTQGRQVAYVHSTTRTTHLLDLQTQTTRPLLDAQKGADGAALSALELSCFSPDDRFLAGTSGVFVVIVDVNTGAIVAKHRYKEDPRHGSLNKLAFAPDGQALAWGYGDEIVVIDLKEKQRITMPKGTLAGWQSSEQLLIGRELDTEQPGLELWDWRNRQRTAAWHMPIEVMTWATGDPMYRPPLWIKQSRDRQCVLFACAPKLRGPNPMMSMVRGWLGLPEPPSHVIEINLLAGDTLRPLASWRIPCDSRRWVYSEPEYFQFTADGRHVIHIGANSVELWSIAPHSWFTSTLWAGAGTLALVAMVSIWRFWRGRKVAPPLPAAQSVSTLEH